MIVSVIGAGERDAFERSLPRWSGRRLDWANLLQSVLLAEVLACVCAGIRRVIAAIDEGPAARKVLRHLGLSHELPRLAPAWFDQSAFWPTAPLWVRLSNHEDACDSPHVDDVQRSLPDFPA